MVLRTKIVVVVMTLGVLALGFFAYRGGFSGFGRNPVLWSDVAESDVVLKVNGQSFTKCDVTAEVNANYKMICIGNNIKPANEIKVRGMLMTRACYELPIRQYFASEFPAGAQIDSSVFAKRYQMYARKFGGKNKTVEAFKRGLDEAGVRAAIEAQMVSELKFEHVLAHNYSNQLAVTKGELDKTFAGIDAYGAKVAATNALLYALATNIWKRVEAGEDFAKVADECSQDTTKEPGGDLGEKTLDDLVAESPEYQLAIKNLKEGEHTGVLESSTGLEIVKLLENVPAIKANCLQDCKHLARIFVRRAYVPDRPSEDEIRKELADEKRTKFLAQTTDEAIAAGKIVYPLGRKVFRLVLPKAETVMPAGDLKKEVN